MKPKRKAEIREFVNNWSHGCKGCDTFLELLTALDKSEQQNQQKDKRWEELKARAQCDYEDTCLSIDIRNLETKYPTEE